MPVAIPKQFAGCLPKDWGVPGAELEALIDCWFKSQLRFLFAGGIPSRMLVGCQGHWVCWLLLVVIAEEKHSQ